MASRLNALHTLPAPLAPASGFWARGKSLVKFYKTGITNVWQNRKTANKLRAQYGLASSLGLARSIVENAHLAGIEQNVLKSPARARVSVTRDELLTLYRTERDLRKLPLFVVVFAVCFEMTPLVLWKFPKIAPSTCWSESVNKSIREKYSSSLAELHAHGRSLNGSESVFMLSTPALRSLTSTLNLGIHYKIAPRRFVAQRVLDHLTLVRADDVILRENTDKLSTLVEPELTSALMARGLPLDGGLNALRAWLDEFVEPMDAGFFLRPHLP